MDRRAPMHRTNIKRWAKLAVASMWPRLFRWTHLPIVVRRRASGPRPVLLGRDMYLESRESPTTIWRLDPIVAAAISSGLMGELTRQLPSWTAERYGISFPGTSGTGESRPGA